MRANVLQVARVQAWLSVMIEPTKTISPTLASSYGLKHQCESDVGYVTNGSFIAAALLAGFPHVLRSGSPNVWFGMSRLSWRHAIAFRLLWRRR